MAEDEEYVEDDQDVKNDVWFKQNYLDLIQDYPNLWIAVLDQKVVASGNSRRQAERDAREAVGDKKVTLYFIEPSDIMP